MLKIKSNTLLLFCCFAFPSFLFSQTLKGKIIDKKSNLPVVYAHVLLPNEYGVVSNQEGVFTLVLKDEHLNVEVKISALGYETITMNSNNLSQNIVIAMEPSEFILDEVVVGNSINAHQIIENYVKNSSKNHKISNQKLVCFKRTQESILPEEMSIEVERANFQDKKEFQKKLDDFSNKFRNKKTSNYKEYLYEIYSNDKTSKVNLVKGLKLKDEHGLDMDNFENVFFENVFKDLKSPYTYKIKSGWIPLDRKASLDKMDNANVSDSLIGKNIHNFRLLNFATNLDFIKTPKLYDYVFEGIKDIHGFSCYHISFLPQKRKGKYKGNMYINTEDFAMIHYKYELEEDKKEFGINLKWILGIKINSFGRSQEVVFTKSKDGLYFPLMSRVTSSDYAYIHRGLTMKENHPKRSKRKVLELDFKFEMTQQSQEEVLIVDAESITNEAFEKVQVKDFIIFETKFKYDPLYWNEFNVLEATKEMKSLTP